MQKHVNLVDPVKSFPSYVHLSKSNFMSLSMSLLLNLLFEPDSYSNEYLLAKFGFDTAENEPCKNSNFLTFLTPEF